MSEKDRKEWPFYVLVFFALWAVNVSISFAARLPSQYVKDVVLQNSVLPAFLALGWYLLRLSRSRDKK